ncbi:ABC transporter ATP-binding protein [Candidatus Saccharibacteria bacterium]|nr:MAG: ABC transporter ATP-binding protein [Candidatus Saccharibacteria bacterium]
MIEVANITKTYGKKDSAFTALDDISLSIKDGATVAIIGKSGSGKSTLMHIMSGLDTPSDGHVTVDGTVLQQMKPKQIDAFRAEQMSFIFQAFFVEGNQTCYQNVMLPLEIAEVRGRDRKQRVMDALAAVDLSEKANSRARNLSGGQKQRLAIARAIVNRPKLIFADEPTGNLDSATGDKIIDLLFSINKTLGSTLVIVTHDDELAARCKIQVRLKDGKIDSLVTKPTRKTVARAKK